ncbi:MAG: Amuc_1100 family pilus-like protein [Verrucomicrobiota bacterium]|nr:Amuc_1100 family pilus-like protein [Verrucomicrobiota bacterium]
MNWFRQNKFLGGFLVALGACTLLSLFFLLHEKGAAAAEQERLETTITELNRLRGSSPFPNEANLSKAKAQTDSYRSSLLALEEELKNRMFPKPDLQPNEFQSLLRQATTAVMERARAAKVQLPENFNLGFDEYATSLPNSLAAPRLGRQLRAIVWVVNTIIDAHVDSLTSLTRSPLPEERATAPTTTPAAAGAGKPAKMPPAPAEKLNIVDSTSIDLVFAGSPAALRRVFNQVAAAKEQFYIIRTVQVKNQVDKGPKRGGEAAAVPALPTAGASNPPEQGISFIVGTEHVNVAAKIEILRFNFPEKEGR